MKTKPNDCGPAFPQQIVYHNGEWIQASAMCGRVEGMSLRQYYAGQALGGFLSRREYDDETFQTAAKDAVRYADALIAELEKEGE